MTTDPNDAAGRIAAFLDGAMIVVTASDGAEHGGCLVGFHTQASIEPWRHLVAVSVANHTFRVARRATHLAVHLLTRRHRELAGLFGADTGDRIDKFAHCAWEDGPAGVPILTDAAGWFAGRVLDRLDLGDHVGHLIEPVAGVVPAGTGPLLTYSDVHGLDAGHEA